MAEPRLTQQTRAALAEIVVGPRLRPVSEAGVASLLASIAETGVMKDPVDLRRKKDGSLHLMAGAHRVEAARRLGWEDVPAKIWTDVTDDWARLIEIDDNLAGAELGPLDTAVFLAARKRVYERLHPETRRGVAGALARWDASDIVSFASSTAEKFGLSRRHVERLIAIGERISPAELAHLRQAKAPVQLRDLTYLARLGDPVERADVVLRLATGAARSAPAARKSLRVEAGLEAPVKAPEDRAYVALARAWSRAGAAARKRFLREFGQEVWKAQNAGAPLLQRQPSGAGGEA
jgi:ParB family chromosome partitioning protein